MSDIVCVSVDMKKDKVLLVRTTEEEHQRVADYANAKDISMAKVLRDYIKRLPNFSKIENFGQE